MKLTNFPAKSLLRVVSGLLALSALGLVILRLYALSATGIPMGPGRVMHALRLLFPLSLVAFFGYMAIKGKFPFMSDEPRRRGDKR